MKNGRKRSSETRTQGTVEEIAQRWNPRCGGQRRIKYFHELGEEDTKTLDGSWDKNVHHHGRDKYEPSPASVRWYQLALSRNIFY